MTGVWKIWLGVGHLGASRKVVAGDPYGLNNKIEKDEGEAIVAAAGSFAGRASPGLGQNHPGLGYFGVTLLQLLPIILWFEFHGRGISDGTPPSWFTAHWLFALPHILLLGGRLGLIFLLFSRRKGVLPGSPR